MSDGSFRSIRNPLRGVAFRAFSYESKTPAGFNMSSPGWRPPHGRQPGVKKPKQWGPSRDAVKVVAVFEGRPGCRSEHLLIHLSLVAKRMEWRNLPNQGREVKTGGRSTSEPPFAAVKFRHPGQSPHWKYGFGIGYGSRLQPSNLASLPSV